MLRAVDVAEGDSHCACIVELLAPVAYQVFGVGVVGTHGEHAEHGVERHIVLR